MKKTDRRTKTIDSFIRFKRNGKYECLNCGKELETHRRACGGYLSGNISAAKKHVISCLKKTVIF